MSIQEAVNAAKMAGFTDGGLVEIVAIAGHESRWQADATADTRRYSERRDDGLWYVPGSDEHLPEGVWPEYSVGPLQINLNVHPEIAEWEARWWPTAFAYGYQLSQGGSDFSPWSTAGLVTEDDRNAVRGLIEQPSMGASAPASEYDGTALDAVRSTQAVRAAWQLIAAGHGALLEAGPGAGEVTLRLTALRGEWSGAVPELGDILPT